MRPIVITGGGTGGHVFPMQAIGDALLARGEVASDLRFVGSRRGLEATLLAGDIGLTLLPGRGVRRSMAPRAMWANLGALVGLAGAFVMATWLVLRWRPRAVVSVGGYASLAVSVAAVLWRRPLVLVELDAYASASQRVVRRFATRRCVAFATSEPRCVLTGAPIRDALVALQRDDASMRAARATFVPPLDDHRRVIVVMTGSLGARSVNDVVQALARHWSQRSDRAIIHVSGRRDYERLRASSPTGVSLDYRLLPFADMTQVWAVADAAVTRAGALTVAELTALGIPAVLVPLPGAPGDHQTKNARALVDAGAGLLIPDAELDVAGLAARLDELLEPEEVAVRRARAAALGHRDAAIAIAAVVAEVARS